MWELERETTLPTLARLSCAIVGAGRLGRALAAGLREAGIAVEGPLGRGARCPDADVILLCVPDGEIANAAAAIERHGGGAGPCDATANGAAVKPHGGDEAGSGDATAAAHTRGPLVGHCSGATTLAPLAPHEAFSLHPLMTVPADGSARFAGASAAIAGTTPHARGVAHRLALHLGLTPFEVDDEDRAAYHAAASVASNFLVTLEAAAEQLAASAGVDRAALVPLVRATVENWASLGPERALTGPLVRGDEATVARQRAAIAERAPDLLALFDTLAEATRSLAGKSRSAAGGIEGEAAVVAEPQRSADADRAGGAGEDDFATPLAKSPRPVTGPARQAAGARA